MADPYPDEDLLSFELDGDVSMGITCPAQHHTEEVLDKVELRVSQSHAGPDTKLSDERRDGRVQRVISSAHSSAPCALPVPRRELAIWHISQI